MSVRATKIQFDADLPISAHVHELTQTLQSNQVIIVCGETGSGKSTQLPKICLQAGFGERAMIAHTQPRRIAARAIATRVSQELQSQLGDIVGFRVRFSEAISANNKIRVLTDGMLLAEYQSDPMLRQYEVIIIDEAHERSLNIDFLLGLLKRLLPKRPELKVIITSATLNSDEFSNFFNNAPTFFVSGRTYPVEIRYAPSESNSIQRDSLNEEIAQAILQLHHHAIGDVLVFLPGEREIHAASRFLQKRLKSGIDVLPLYARLSPQEQNRIFNPSGRTRVVLATNVAETSLTVPGIKYVVDTGFARISRYSASRKIQRLPIERISQAAAAQRSGRCGRVSDGICIRLYSEEDFISRAPYTDAEILRTSLSDVILKMAVMKMGAIEDFPFIARPSKQQINDGFNQLVELGALNNNHELTKLGKQISTLPIDPRIARMLIESLYLGCLHQIITIASVLSIGDPRVVPADKMELARTRHASLSEEKSDFLILLDIWSQFRDIQKNQSKRKAQSWCEENFLSMFRMREWGALQANLLQALKQSKLTAQINLSKRAQGFEPDEAIARALLSGLLCNVAMLDEQVAKEKGKTLKPKQAVYLGTFGKQLKIFPASCLKKQQAKWIMSAELVETSDLFARHVTQIQPQWIEQQARHLLRIEYSNPFWHQPSERVRAYTRGILYGLTVFAQRQSDFSTVDVKQARQIFIQHALVLGQLKRWPDFLQHNQVLIEKVIQKSNQLRKRDGFAQEQDIFDFYDRCIPLEIATVSDLLRWYGRLSDQYKRNLFMTQDDLIKVDIDELIHQYYPTTLFKNQIKIALDYEFNPGAQNDGISAQVDIAQLNQLQADSFERLVPGLFEEKIVALIKALPKALRVNFIPVPETVQAIKAKVESSTMPLLKAMAHELNSLKGTKITQQDFDTQKLPAHLRMKIVLVDDKGEVLETHHDLAYLQDKYKRQSQKTFSKIVEHDWQKSNIVNWNFAKLPVDINIDNNDSQLRAYLALVDKQSHVDIELFDTPEEADMQQLYGLTRLFILQLPMSVKYIQQIVKQDSHTMLLYRQISPSNSLADEIMQLAIYELVFSRYTDIREQSVFEQCLQDVQRTINEKMFELWTLIKQILMLWHECKKQFAQMKKALPTETIGDIDCQLQWLVYDGFIFETPAKWLQHYPNYLHALSYRLQQASLQPALDIKRTEQFSKWWQKFASSDASYDEDMQHFRWMLEEYRIAIFAQQMKKSMKVSEQRLDKMWQQLHLTAL